MSAVDLVRHVERVRALQQARPNKAAHPSSLPGPRFDFATRVQGIDQTTIDALDEQITIGIEEGFALTTIATGLPDIGYLGIRGVFREADAARAEAISRTEIAWAFNRAALSTYGDAGITAVEASDGDGDKPCEERDGRVYDIDDAPDLLHPNCLLTVSPVVDATVDYGPPIAEE